MENKENNEFEYSYTAPTSDERQEVESIRKQYKEPERGEESKIDKLRRLDRRVKNTANSLAIGVGFLGCLLFGAGLSLVLEFNELLWGGVVSLLGFIPMAAANPLHGFCICRGKKKYGEEILRLSEEILNEAENKKKE